MTSATAQAPLQDTARRRLQEGFAALQAGRFAEAARLYEEAAKILPREIGAWIGLAYARRGAGDAAGAAEAARAALKLDPRNIRALILAADHAASEGRAEEAASLYTAAVRSADGVPALPPDLAPEVARAREAADRAAAGYEARLRAVLKTAGFDGPDASPRVAEAMDILLGRRRIFVQEPRSFYFPGLPQIAFYERGDFPWADTVEAAAPAIREELQALLAGGDPFDAYVQADARPHADAHGMAGNADWGAAYLWRDGTPVEEMQARCPAAVEALSAAPLCVVDGVSPSVLFSRLKPGAAIPPHNGLVNVRLICHLPLIVPEGCGFRVGSHTRRWREGELMVFDDTIEHEAWNRGASERIVLLFDVWRPELSQEERAMVAALLSAIKPRGDA